MKTEGKILRCNRLPFSIFHITFVICHCAPHAVPKTQSWRGAYGVRRGLIPLANPPLVPQTVISCCRCKNKPISHTFLEVNQCHLKRLLFHLSRKKQRARRAAPFQKALPG